MKGLICSIFFLVVSSICFSQKVFFVYIQSETEQPFFVKLKDKNFSSSLSGYVILSQLKDSIYNFKVGFPYAKWPEQDFSIAINSADHGFLLKNFSERGWGLVDLQTLVIHMATKRETGKVKMELETVSSFTEVLAKAANDPSLREKPVFAVAQEEKPLAQQTVEKGVVVKEPDPKTQVTEKMQESKDTAKAIAVTKSRFGDSINAVNKIAQPKKDSLEVLAGSDSPKKNSNQAPAVIDTNKSDVELAKSDDARQIDKTALSHKTKSEISNSTQESKIKESVLAKNKPDKPDSVIVKDVAKSVPEGQADLINKGADTRRTENEQVPTTYKRSVISKKSESSSLDGLGLVFIDQYPGGTKDTITIFIPNSVSGFKSEGKIQEKENKFLDIDGSGEPVLNSAGTRRDKCQAVAAQNDFLSLRKKMAGQKNDEAMLTEATKAFKSKCYTSDQVKNLGALFLTEPGKFQFFEAAYPFTSDPLRFEALQAEFKDAYFIHRFKNLVK